MKAAVHSQTFEVLADAEAAHLRVKALMEILDGCPADYKITPALFVGLLESVSVYLDNVVSDLRTQGRMPPDSVREGMRIC